MSGANSNDNTLGTDQVVVTSADGYIVTINASKLDAAAKKVGENQQDTAAMMSQVKSTLVPSAAFGSVPHGPTVAAALATSFNDHVKAVQSMGLSLGDLGNRIQEAASIAFAAEPDTVKVASPFSPNGTPVTPSS